MRGNGQMSANKKSNKSANSQLGKASGVLVTNADRQYKRNTPDNYDAFKGGSAKHRLYQDFGYPFRLNPKLIREIYERSSLASAAVSHSVRRCWIENPILRRTDGEMDSQEMALEAAFERLNFWQRFQDADKRGMVGCYAALILRIADNKMPHEPVDSISGGIDKIVEVIPAWETDIVPLKTYDDPSDPETYGKVMMYEYREKDYRGYSLRKLPIHPDRVLIVSQDGTVTGRSVLEPGFNALINAEKIDGAAAEGIYKNARMTLHLNVEAEAELEDQIEEPSAMQGLEGDTFAEQIIDQVDKLNSKFENFLVTQNMKSTVLNTDMSNADAALFKSINVFAASIPIPMRVLMGSQSGERAASEDAKEWARTCEARRSYMLRPVIRQFIERLIKWNVIEGKEWRIEWTSLTEATQEERMAILDRLIKANDQAWRAGQRIAFTRDEMRDEAGYKPLEPGQESEEIAAMYPDELDPDPHDEEEVKEGGNPKKEQEDDN